MRNMTHSAVTHRSRLFVAIALLAAIVLSTVAIAVSAPGATDGASVVDDETVYVIMDQTGNVEKTVVVDWLKVEGDGSMTVSDRGATTSVEALKDELAPSLSGDTITWDLQVDGRRDFFYRAETEQALPLDVEATYFLDGAEIDPEALADQNGRVKIEIDLENLLPVTRDVEYENADGAMVTEPQDFWQPLLVVVQVSLDGTLIDNIVEEADMMNVTGSTMSYTFMAFPQPTETVTIEMDAVDFAIEPIYVSIFPDMPAGPEIDIENLLVEMREGADGLARLSGGHVQILDGMLAGFDSSEFEGIDQLGTGIAALATGTGEAKTGLDDLTSALGVHVGITQGLQTSNSALTALALDRVLASGGIGADATMTALWAGLAMQDSMLTTLTAGGLVDVAPGVTQPMPSLSTVNVGLQGISAGLAEIITALETMTSQSAMLDQIPTAMEQFRAALSLLRDGGTFQGQYVPGITASVDGLEAMSTGLGEGISGARVGSKLVEVMEATATEYDTFLGKPEGAESRLRFIMKLEGITAAE